MIGLAACNQLLLDNYNTVHLPLVLSSSSPPERDVTPYTPAAAKSVYNTIIWPSELKISPSLCKKQHYNCNTDKQTRSFHQHTSTAKPRQQEKEGDGELNAAELSQKSLHKKGIDIFIHRSIQCIRQSSAGLSHTHQWSLTEVKAKHYSHLICISKNSDNIYLYLN